MNKAQNACPEVFISALNISRVPWSSHSAIQPKLTGSLLGSPWEHETEDTPFPSPRERVPFPVMGRDAWNKFYYRMVPFFFFFYQSWLCDLTLSLILFQDDGFFLLLSPKYYFIQYILINILTECFLFSMINKELTQAKFPSLKSCNLVD